MFLKVHHSGLQSVTCRGQKGIPPPRHVFWDYYFFLSPFLKPERGPKLQLGHWTGWVDALRRYQVFCLSGAWLTGSCSHAQRLPDHPMLNKEEIFPQVRLVGTLSFLPSSAAKGMGHLPGLSRSLSLDQFSATAGVLDIGCTLFPPILCLWHVII